MKRAIIDNIKNIPGWKTDRKIIVFSVDDYGNVRLDSKQAREKMDKAGLKVHSRFDAYDTLETGQDLEALYEVLTSVKDMYGNLAVFTPFALPCNINFEAMAEGGYESYIYEALPETYAKLEGRHPEAYTGAWKLWQEGIEKGLMAPEFHGREHMNLKVFEDKLEQRDHEVLTALKNRSYTSISNIDKTYGYTAAFGFEAGDEIDWQKEIIEDGLDKFEDVYGIKSLSFTPPAAQFNEALESVLFDFGIKTIHKAFIEKRMLNYTGKKRKSGLTSIVRNVVFEPTVSINTDVVTQAIQQIENAFRWRKPAIISSHRVNFCGLMDEENRNIGLSALKDLLSEIESRWDDVEFMSVSELTSLILKSESDGT